MTNNGKRGSWAWGWMMGTGQINSSKIKHNSLTLIGQVNRHFANTL